MRSLFGRDGDRLSVLRQPMGSSDFVAGEHYTYDDLPPGRMDYRMRRFSIDHDRRQILPLLRQALRLEPQLKVIGTPWSAPAWMKTNGSLIGGRLIDDPRIYEAYARYFVRFVRAYRRAGVPVYAVTVQNEPQNRLPSGYPGMDLPVAQEAKLIVAIGRRSGAPGSGRRSSATTTTGARIPPTSRRRRRARTPNGYPTDLLGATRAGGSPAPRSTATAAIPAARPSCTARSRTRASGSRSARARTGRPTRPRRSSPTRSSGTRATSCSASPATGARPS